MPNVPLHNLELKIQLLLSMQGPALGEAKQRPMQQCVHTVIHCGAAGISVLISHPVTFCAAQRAGQQSRDPKAMPWSQGPCLS